MDEREISKLWYLAEAVTNSPANWEQVLDVALKNSAIAPSPPLRQAIEALRKALARHTHELASNGRDVLQRVALELMKKSGPAAEAGRAVAWALETTPPRRRATG